MGASLVAQQWRICLQCRRHRFDPWVRKIPWRRAWQPTPVSLPGEAPWTEEPGGLQSTGSQSVRHDLATTPQPTDERGDSLHRQLVTCCPDIPLPLSAEVTTTWKCCWHRNPTSAPRPAPPQSLSGPHWAYLSAFSDGCPLDTQGLRRQRRRSRTDARSWERGALTALQRPRDEQSGSSYKWRVPRPCHSWSCTLEKGPSGQWIFAEGRKIGTDSEPKPSREGCNRY